MVLHEGHKFNTNCNAEGIIYPHPRPLSKGEGCLNGNGLWILECKFKKGNTNDTN